MGLQIKRTRNSRYYIVEFFQNSLHEIVNVEICRLCGIVLVNGVIKNLVWGGGDYVFLA